jgi:hypothetical protein
MTSRNTRSVGHVARMENVINAYKILVLVSDAKRPLDDLGVGRRITFSLVEVTYKTGFGLDD